MPGALSAAKVFRVACAGVDVFTRLAESPAETAGLGDSERDCTVEAAARYEAPRVEAGIGHRAAFRGGVAASRVRAEDRLLAPCHRCRTAPP